LEASRKSAEADDQVDQHKRKSEQKIREIKKKASEATEIAAKQVKEA